MPEQDTNTNEVTVTDSDSTPTADDSPQLTAEEIAARFGAKVRTVTGWLERHGFAERAEEGRRDGRPVKLYRESILPQLAATVGKPLLSRSESPQVGTGLQDELIQEVIRAKDETIQTQSSEIQSLREQLKTAAQEKAQLLEVLKHEQELSLYRMIPGSAGRSVEIIAATHSETATDGGDSQNQAQDAPGSTHSPSIPPTPPPSPENAPDGQKPGFFETIAGWFGWR